MSDNKISTIENKDLVKIALINNNETIRANEDAKTVLSEDDDTSLKQSYKRIASPKPVNKPSTSHNHSIIAANCPGRTPLMMTTASSLIDLLNDEARNQPVLSTKNQKITKNNVNDTKEADSLKNSNPDHHQTPEPQVIKSISSASNLLNVPGRSKLKPRKSSDIHTPLMMASPNMSPMTPYGMRQDPSPCRPQAFFPNGFYPPGDDNSFASPTSRMNISELLNTRIST